MENLYYYLVLTILFIFFAIKLVFTRNRNLPPTPPFALPIIGHLHLIKKPLYLALESLLSQHGPILYLRFGSRPVLVLSSPYAVEECFTKNDITFANRPKSMAGDHFTYNYTSYVWAPYGHLWRSLRRFTVVELFSSNAIHKSSSAIQTEVRHHLLRRVFRNSTSDGKVDLKNLFSLLMINFMMRIVAGSPGTEDEAAESEIEKKFLAEFKEVFYPSLSMNVCDFFPILRLIGYKGIEKKFVKLQKLRDEYLEKIIDGIRSKKNTCSMDGGEKKIMSLVENLLSLQQSEPEFYTDVVIKSIIMMMFIAGVETTSITLEWAMSLLLNHPEAMQKVKAEIDRWVAVAAGGEVAGPRSEAATGLSDATREAAVAPSNTMGEARLIAGGTGGSRQAVVAVSAAENVTVAGGSCEGERDASCAREFGREFGIATSCIGAVTVEITSIWIRPRKTLLKCVVREN
ncbi:hypothetical protein LWI29_001638 [Acer saccharum]|uniref:Cytochrome P450 n=1 Tax=Acer saccharum TaxID=4024 RepID=A0AA39RJS6_ACESA|nr:hypothetical protein LWI29_001638 [Acer saccharum]